MCSLCRFEFASRESIGISVRDVATAGKWSCGASAAAVVPVPVVEWRILQTQPAKQGAKEGLLFGALAGRVLDAFIKNGKVTLAVASFLLLPVVLGPMLAGAGLV